MSLVLIQIKTQINEFVKQTVSNEVQVHGKSVQKQIINTSMQTIHQDSNLIESMFTCLLTMCFMNRVRFIYAHDITLYD